MILWSALLIMHDKFARGGGNVAMQGGFFTRGRLNMGAAFKKGERKTQF
jgi:hypothetical protein